jgi:hypothetical protein
VYDTRDCDDDPRDGLICDLDLPRGNERELVVDRAECTSSTAKTATRLPSSVRSASATEPIDDTSTGKLMEGVLAAFAQFDNDVRSDPPAVMLQESLNERGRVVSESAMTFGRRERAEDVEPVVRPLSHQGRNATLPTKGRNQADRPVW